MHNASPLLAQAPTDPGFKLPDSSSTPNPAANPTGATNSNSIEVLPEAAPVVNDTSTREMAIASGILFFLLIVFFFARNAYVHHLVSKRVSPSSAGSAGWLLFVGLFFVSAAIVLAVLNSVKFLTLLVTGPLLLIGVGSLIGAAFVGRR